MKRPVKNALAFLLGEVGSRLVGFAVTVYLARTLSLEGFGLISIGLAILGHLSIVASPGMALLETRNAAAERGFSRERTGGVIMVRVIIAVLLCALVWAAIAASAAPKLGGHLTLIYVASLLPMAVSLDWFYQGKERMGVVSAARLLNFLVYGSVVFITVKTLHDVLFAALGFLAGAWASALLFQFLYPWEFGKMLIRWHPSLWWQIFRENLPVGAGMFLGQLVINLPPIVLGLILSTVAVGRFSAAAKIAFLFLVLDRLFNALFLPLLSRHLAQGTADVRRLFQITLKGVIVTMLPVAATGILLASWLMQLVFGQVYSGSFPLLQLLMVYVFLTVVNSVFVCALLGVGRTKAYLGVMGRGGAVLALAVLLGTFTLGEIGTAFGVVVGEASVLLFSMREASRALPFTVGRVAAAVGVGMVELLLLPAIAGPLGPAPGALAAAVMVAVVLSVLGGISSAEVLYLRERLV
jgi:O-antigen/teichoic acid export membrane protein